MPRRAPLLGRGEGDSPPSETHDAPLGRHQPGDDLQDGGLARAVGAQQGQRLALAHLEGGVEEGLHVPVAEVHSPHLQGWHRGGVGGEATVLGHLLPQIGGGQGQVAPDEASTPVQGHSADDVGRNGQNEHRGAVAEVVGEPGRQQRTADSPDQEDVQGYQRQPHTAQPVRDDALDQRDDHAERAYGQQAVDYTHRGEGDDVGHQELDGGHDRHGHDAPADHGAASSMGPPGRRGRSSAPGREARQCRRNRRWRRPLLAGRRWRRTAPP